MDISHENIKTTLVNVEEYANSLSAMLAWNGSRVFIGLLGLFIEKAAFLQLYYCKKKKKTVQNSERFKQELTNISYVITTFQVFFFF